MHVCLLIQNEYGETALFGACRGRHTEITRILLDLGASIDLQNAVSQLSFTHLLNVYYAFKVMGTVVHNIPSIGAGPSIALFRKLEDGELSDKFLSCRGRLQVSHMAAEQ